MLTEEQIELQKIIVAYLGLKLGVESSWYTTKQDFLFDQSPQEVIDKGEGKHLVRWMEERLGLRPGAGF